MFLHPSGPGELFLFALIIRRVFRALSSFHIRSAKDDASTDIDVFAIFLNGVSREEFAHDALFTRVNERAVAVVRAKVSFATGFGASMCRSIEDFVS